MLYITYNANGADDGGGAQLLRIVSAYLLSKYYNIGYIHTPIINMTNYGLSCLENKNNDVTQLERYNSLVSFPSDTDKEIDNIIVLSDVNSSAINDYKQRAINKDILLKVTFPIFNINSNPHILELNNLINFTWCNSQEAASSIKIAVHIRRGDINFIEKNIRYLPNSYYVNLMKYLENILSGFTYEFHIYTETATKPLMITSDLRSDLGGINTILQPETFDEFNEFKNITWHINTDPVDTFVELCNANILITSISAFSYLAGILNKNAIVIQSTRMHHPPKRDWILTDSSASFLQNMDFIISKMSSKSIKPLPLKYISGGALGDFIHQLGVIYEMYKKTGRKGILYISHSARNSDYFPFGLEAAFNDTYKLISSQKYIESYHIHTNQAFDINLSSWVRNQPLFKNNWKNMFLAEYDVNWCTEKYLDIPIDTKYSNTILISSSIKRFNKSIDYVKLFRELPVKPIFVTNVMGEYDNFKYRTGIDIDYEYFDNLYDFYVAINSCKLFIGNLSSPLTIAQATWKPRICILQPDVNDNDNIHMRDLDKAWENCLYIHNSTDQDRVKDFVLNLF